MNKIFKIVCTFLLSLTMVTPFLINKVNAETLLFAVPYQEPSTSDNQGYVSVLFENSNGGYFILTFIWNITNETANGGNSGMQLTINDNTVKFVAQLPNNDTGYSLIYRYNGAGDNITVNQYQYFTTTCTEYKYTTSSYTIRGFQAKGNVKYLVDEVSSPQAFSIRWGDSNALNNKIDTLVSNIQNMGITNQSLLDEVENINGDLATITTKINNIYTKINSIYSEIQTTNTWLEDIREGISLTNTYIIQVRNAINDKLDILANKFDQYFGTDKDLSNDINNAENKNDQLSSNVDEYIELDNQFNADMNDSLNNIDKNIELIGNNDFINTATFISTNINRIVTSNSYYNAFVITGLILGLALIMIGKKVI